MTEQKINIKIKGMHCKSCTMLVTDALEDINVKSDVKVGEASLTFDDSKVSMEQIKAAIKQEGFEVV